MPKVDIDYSNTIFYKIFCKEPSIKDLYVGMTTNFVQRKHAHKQSCTNEKIPMYNCKLYKAIRNAGGWENWQMEIIAFHNCKDSYEARKKEQEYFEILGATLNSIEPLPKPKEPSVKIIKEKTIMYCEACNVYFSHWKAQEIHNNTNKHHKRVSIYKNNNIIVNKTQYMENSSKVSQKFICEKCKFTCSKQSNYDRHLLTRKHQMVVNGSKMVGEKMPTTYTCICGNVYKHNSGYCRHKKVCKKMPEIFCDEEVSKNNETPPDVMLQLLKDNKEFKAMIIEQQQENQKLQGQLIEALKDRGNTTNNYNNTTNNN